MGRHLASSGVDVYTAVGGGIGALYGPLHGGANEAVLRMLARIKTVDNIPAFIAGVKNRKEKLFGFGHRCAPRYPPHSHPAHTISSSSPPPLLIHTMHTRSPPILPSSVTPRTNRRSAHHLRSLAVLSRIDWRDQGWLSAGRIRLA